MTDNAVLIAVFAAVSLLSGAVGLAVYHWAFRYRDLVNARLHELARDDADAASVSLFKESGQRGASMLTADSLRATLQRLIDQSGLRWTVGTLAWATAAAAAAGAAVALSAGVGNTAACVAAVCCSAAPIALLYSRRHSRTKRLTKQLPEAFQLISRTVRAGQTVPAALKLLSEEFKPPLSEEFALCYEQQNLGMSKESALRKLADRTGILELKLFVVAVFVQSKSGGDLMTLLDNLALMVQKRLRLKDRVRALTGEGRMQANVLLLLPLAAMAAILALAPEYAASIMARPWLLLATAGAQLAGVFWIRRIVNFDY